MSYSGYIARIKGVRKHNNADRLQVGTIFGNDVIVGLDIQEGDLMFYLPTDGKVGLEFAQENNLLRLRDKDGNSIQGGGYLDEKRHITTLKLRGERSDGLALKITSLSKFTDISQLKEGDMISVLGGIQICEKYIPYRKPSNPNPSNKVKGKKTEEKESFPLFKEHIDTAQLAYNLGQFKAGDQCIITLKMHGTSHRVAHLVKEEKVQSFWGKAFRRKPKVKRGYDYVSGTRRVVLKSFDGGFYGSNAFRQQWHDFFVGKLPKGMSVYLEIVGYTDDGKLIMPECKNKLTNDKAFIKQYGETTKFTYGCSYGQSDIYVYRMTFTNEDGETFEVPWYMVKLYCEKFGVKYTPELETFTFTTPEDLMERIKKYEDMPDPVGKTHVSEGVVVRIENREKFTALKHKNFSFKLLEGIIKATADEADMEESQDEQVEE